jgi:hypothetical protein
MGIELIKHFAPDYVKASSCIFRIFAFQELVASEFDKLLSPWIRTDDNDKDYFSIREGVAALAAKFPLNKEAQFDTEAFIEELIATVPTQEIEGQGEG